MQIRNVKNSLRFPRLSIEPGFSSPLLKDGRGRIENDPPPFCHALVFEPILSIFARVARSSLSLSLSSLHTFFVSHTYFTYAATEALNPARWCIVRLFAGKEYDASLLGTRILSIHLRYERLSSSIELLFELSLELTFFPFSFRSTSFRKNLASVSLKHLSSRLFPSIIQRLEGMEVVFSQESFQSGIPIL